MMTFGELNDKIDIYIGTDVDSATQEALLEWLFDKYLSMDDDTNTSIDKWLRWYHRYLNMNYPIYLDLLKMDAVRSTMDPFITELIEKITEGSLDSTVTGTSSKEGSSTRTSQTERDTDITKSQADNRSDSEHTVTDNTETRTPDLEYTDNGTTGNTKTRSDSERTLTDNQEVRTPNLTTSGTTGNTRTDNTQTAVSGTDTGTVRTDTNIDVDDDSKSRAMNITYPEANMNAIPQDLNNFPTNIDYAEGEADQFSHGDHVEDNDTTETRNLANSSTTNNTGTVTDSGTNSQVETGTEQIDFDGDITKTNTGTDTDSGTSSNIRKETGTDQKDFDGDVTRSLSSQGSQSGTENTDESLETSEHGSSAEVGSTSQSTSTENGGQEDIEGRHESIADILPRAVAAIKTTNALKWFVNVLQPCFDNYSEM